MNILKKLIGLKCTSVNNGQAKGILVINFSEWKFNFECTWFYKNGSSIISNSNDAELEIPLDLDGLVLSDIKQLDRSNVNIQLLFDNGAILDVVSDNDKFESWQLLKNDKLILVAGPSDKLSSFNM